LDESKLLRIDESKILENPKRLPHLVTFKLRNFKYSRECEFLSNLFYRKCVDSLRAREVRIHISMTLGIFLCKDKNDHIPFVFNFFINKPFKQQPLILEKLSPSPVSIV